MVESKTHVLRKEPRITARHLADFMAASEPAKRTTIRMCKFAPRAPLLQHDEARGTISKFIRDKDDDIGWLSEEARRLRDKIADTNFERDEYDNNADYISRFAKVWPEMKMPKADFLLPGKTPDIIINGVTIALDLAFRLRRLTKNNKIRVGAAMLRYAKNKALPPRCRGLAVRFFAWLFAGSAR